jgi:signal transduction histidine kinase
VAGFVWSVVLGLIILQAVWLSTTSWSAVPASLRPDSSSNFAGLFTVLMMASVGWLIAVRRPENRIGWLLLGIAFLGTSVSFPNLYVASAVYLHWHLPAAEWVYWIEQLPWIILIGSLLVVLPLLFPDGHLLSRRWVIPIGLLGLLTLTIELASLDPRATAPLHNPMGIAAFSGYANFITSGFFVIPFSLICASGMVSLVVRYRRGDDREREQLKWLLAAVVVLLLAVLLQLVANALSGWPLIPVAAAFLPIAIGIAVLRYRLYDIDLIINKALVYGSLAVLITAAYLLVVIGIGALVGSRHELLLSILTTVVVAVSFQPVRQRTQRLANRLVYGRRSTPYETLSQFSDHLSESVSQDALLEQMAGVLAQGTGAERAEVWVRVGSSLVLGSASPANGTRSTSLPMRNGTLPEMERDAFVPVMHQGELLGALTVVKRRGETMRPVEQKLLSDLAGQAGLVLNNVRLNRELLARLEELRASRQRLVTVQDTERRRIERDLHDGAQQHLVALKIKLGLAEAAAEPESQTRIMLAQLKRDADEALTTMRELARGIYPPLLASDGLPAALSAHIRRLPSAVELQAVDLPRQPREIESAVYFCVLEALQNVSKYSSASTVGVRLWVEGSKLAFRVEDNGKGFDTSALKASSGIQNMRDRLEALGGSLNLTSEPGKGTTVEGRLPLAIAVPEPALV